ncbi:endospore germination permease [Sutcliffiella halmapala]|uniref:endospore germination permease n=1 Tax=Sutcliffiella halmapala TaxID=79882 RepID=UPI0009949363|nr:endospore germination permease [Sutcliffiella halmapala]
MNFSRLQLSFVILLFIGISNHVLMLPHLLYVAKRDAWICVIIAYLILIIWGSLFYLILSKNKREKLFSWIKMRAGRGVSIAIIFLLIIYILIIATISFYDFIITIKIYFLPLTPSWIVVLPFLLLCAWAASKSLKSIVYISTILLPMVWILGHFVAFATMNDKDYSYLLPVMISGSAPIIHGTIVVLGGSVDLIILLLLQQHLKKSFTLSQIIILITLLMGLVLGPALGSLSAFGPNVASIMRFPAFEQWRLVELGEHISHLDFLAVFQLISGASVRVALCLFLLTDLIETQSESMKRNIFIFFSVFLILVGIIPISDIWMQTVVGKYFYPSVLLFGVAITLVLLIISYLPTKKKGVSNV